MLRQSESKKSVIVKPRIDLNMSSRLESRGGNRMQSSTKRYSNDSFILQKTSTNFSAHNKQSRVSLGH